MRLVNFKSKNIIESNRTIKRILEICRQNNTRTPLTSQVVALDIPSDKNINNILNEADTERESINVTLQLSPHHINRYSTKWRATPRHIKLQRPRQKWENARHHKRSQKEPLTQDKIKAMILDGSITSVISNKGDTSTAGKGGDSFRTSNIPSDKVFDLPTGGTARASVKAKLMHELQEPAT